MQELHLFLDGGLGNRLQGLASGLKYANELNIKPSVLWPANIDCNSNIDDLFSSPSVKWAPFNEISPSFSFGGEGKLNSLLISMNRGLSLSNLPYPRDLIDSITRIEYIEPLSCLDYSAWSGFDRVIIAPYHYFWAPGMNRNDVEDAFIQLAQQNFVNKHVFLAYTDFINANHGIQSAITVHARRPYTHRETPIEELVHNPDRLSNQDYLKICEFAIGTKDECKVFFCTNSPSLESLVLQTFGSKVIVLPKHSVANDDPLAIQDALVEMLCMSQTSHIIASSSFSACGALLGGKKYTWIGPGCTREIAMQEASKVIQRCKEKDTMTNE